MFAEPVTLIGGLVRTLCVAVGLGLMGVATGHDMRAGDLVIDHPYAMPSQPGATTSTAHFRGLRNKGTQGDKLVAASTPVAERVVLQRLAPPTGSQSPADLAVIDLPAGGTVNFRHDGGFRLLLSGLRQPLKDGDRFDLSLNFERAGRHTVKVWVQTPRTPSGAHAH